MKRVAVFTLGIIILAAAMLSGCQDRIGNRTEAGFCGDGLCNYYEKTTCSLDCTPVFNANQADTPDELNWVEETQDRRKEETQNTSGERFDRPIDDRVEPALPTPKIEYVLPEKGFRVANRYNLLSIGENISGVMGTLTGAHLTTILRGGTYRSNTEAFGPRFSFYEQYLTLRSGRVLFGTDDSEKIITTYLSYNEGEPILEYYIRMNGGIFKFFQGQEINFLGHKYLMMEITNSSMLFIGTESNDSILLRNGHGSVVNGVEISSDRLNVTFGYDYIRVIVNAPEDLKILPNQQLTSFIKRTNLLTNRLDMEYQGLTPAAYNVIFFDKKGSDYRLNFQNNIGENYSIPLARINPFQVGNDQYAFHFQEGDGNIDYTIGKKDYFVISNAREIGGITTLLRLVDVDYDGELVKFEDPSLESFYVKFDGDVGTNAFADMLVHGVNHRVYVGAGERVAVDLNGDGRISSTTSVPLIAAGNTLVRLSESNNTLTAKVVVPGSRREDTKSDLETIVEINNRGVRVLPTSLKMEYDGKTDRMIGLNNYGAAYILRNTLDKGLQLGDELMINQPLTQRFAEVILKAYE